MNFKLSFYVLSRELNWMVELVEAVVKLLR